MMRDAFTEIERARSALWSLDPGCDAAEHFKIAAGFADGGGDFDEFNRWSANGRGYGSESACRSVWKSASAPGPVTVATLFKMARDSGWTDDGEAPANRPQSQQGQRKEREVPKTLPHDPKALWNDDCTPATADQEYIDRKKGLPDGLRVYHGPLKIAGMACDSALVLPIRSLAGDLVNLQFVILKEHVRPGDKDKLFLPGIKVSATPDACLVIGGPIKPEGRVYVVEGIGQAWSAHQATRCPAVVAFGVGRMAGVAKALRGHYPAARLVLVADADKESQCAAIAKSVSGAWVEMPAGSPSNYDLNDMHQAEGLGAVCALLEGVKEIPQRFQLLTPADLASRPPARWRVRGVLPLEGIAAIFGPSGSGKSFLVLDLLVAIASGADWFGCRTKAAPVLYIALEGEAGIAQRVHAYQVKHGPLAPTFLFLLQSLDIRSATDRADLVSAVQAAGFTDGVLCLDTLNRAAPGMDENDSQSMGEAIASLKAIQAALGGVVLVVHHTGKDSTRGMRGHSSLVAALDGAVEVIREGDRREWKIFKSKDGRDGEAHPFRLDVVTIDTDEDGEPVTSCGVVPERSVDDPVRRVKLPSGGNQRIVWDGLQNMFKAAGERRPAGVPEELPIGRPVLRLEDAIAKLRSRLAVESDRQTERTRQAVTGLVTRGLLVLREGWLWVA